jgi:hypothetical protein
LNFPRIYSICNAVGSPKKAKKEGGKQQADSRGQKKVIYRLLPATFCSPDTGLIKGGLIVNEPEVVFFSLVEAFPDSFSSRWNSSSYVGVYPGVADGVSGISRALPSIVGSGYTHHVDDLLFRRME